MSIPFENLLARVQATAAAPLPVHADFAAWRATFRISGTTFSAALDAGLAGGQLAFCFAGGYQAALRCLRPSLPPAAFAALLLSEGRRQRPEELQTVLRPLPDGRYRLDGEKSYVTGATAADPLLVVARLATDDHDDAQAGTRAVLLALPPDLPGVTVTPRPAMGLLDALPHGRAQFTAVTVDAACRVPGDGWRDHGRPFRTHEDIHVQAAVAAHLAAEALRAGWPAPLQATLLGCLARLADCAQRDAMAPATHLLLAAAEQELQQVTVAVSGLLAGRDDAFARDWQANQALLALAAPARTKRLEKALAALRAADGARG